MREAHRSKRPFKAHAHWLENGWALRRKHWGQGYASEIGRAGLTYAFDVLAMRAVVSCTARHNLRSRAVMERVGMRYAGEIQTRGTADGEHDVRDDAPFAVCVLLRDDHRHWGAYSHLVEGTQAARDRHVGPLRPAQIVQTSHALAEAGFGACSVRVSG